MHDGKRRKEEHKETRTLLLDIEGAFWGWHGIESLQDARLPVDTSWLWQAVGRIGSVVCGFSCRLTWSAKK